MRLYATRENKARAETISARAFGVAGCEISGRQAGSVTGQ